jgi:hypothetical protein
MSRNSLRPGDSRPKDLNNRSLRLEPLEPRLVLSVTANFLGLIDSSLAVYVKSLSADGSIDRTDMIAIFRRVRSETDGVVNSADLSDLRTIVRNASTLNMPDYVSVLASDVVYSNTANAHYQGKTLGNLTVGSSNQKLTKLVDKWFAGTDLPATGGYSYARASGLTYGTANKPSHYDEKQGALGDCYLIAALGSIADSSQMAIRRMFTWNGDGTWTVRFYYNGKADYVTVNRCLPVSNGQLIFDGYGSNYSNANNSLWLPLLEKAYAQWNETGKTLQYTNTNSYLGIEGGWMGTVYQQALGYATLNYMSTSAYNAKTTLVEALANHQAVTVGTIYSPNYNTTGLFGNHAYNVLSYNGTSGRFTLYNPWGCYQPNTLTWTQLKVNADWFSATTAQSLVATAKVSSRAMLAVSYMALSTNVVTATANTLDVTTVKNAALLVPAAVDAVFVDRVAMTSIDGKTAATTFRSSKWWLSESALSNVAASNAEKSSDNTFADIDDLLASVESQVALAL